MLIADDSFSMHAIKVQGHAPTCALDPFKMGALFQTLGNREDLYALICTAGKAD